MTDDHAHRDGTAAGTTFHSDWTDVESPGIAVVRAVAVVTGQRPGAMPPFHEVMDVDAFNALLCSTSTAAIQFRYAGTDVRVRGNGEIEVSIEAE